MSVTFGLLTLALVPLLAEQQPAGITSIYKTRVHFSVLGVSCSAFLTQAGSRHARMFSVGHRGSERPSSARQRVRAPKPSITDG
jgi:hypothetical protein